MLLTMQGQFRVYIHVMFMHFFSRYIKFMHGGDVAVYGCKTFYRKLKEEYRLGVFENKVLRRIFGPRRDRPAGEW